MQPTAGPATYGPPLTQAAAASSGAATGAAFGTGGSNRKSLLHGVDLNFPWPPGGRPCLGSFPAEQPTFRVSGPRPAHSAIGASNLIEPHFIAMCVASRTEI